jgi:hypothetical protein
MVIGVGRNAMTDPTEPKKSFLDLLSGNTTRVAALITTLVGLPSTLLTCSNQEIERKRSFREAVITEEKAWYSLYDQYLAAVTGKADETNFEKNQVERLKAICQFANREPATFEEYPLGYFFPKADTDSHVSAKRRINELKGALSGAIKERNLIIGEGRCTVRDVNAETKEDEALDASIKGAPTAGSVGVAVTNETQAQRETQAKQDQKKLEGVKAAALAPLSLTLSAGNPEGYDVDIFWCRGGGEEQRFAAAKTLAEKLTGSGQKLASVTLGRVRLRALTLEKQSNPGYPSYGFEVRGEEREARAANELVRFSNANLAGVQFVYRQSTQPTPGYLSMFVCSVPQP